MLFLQRYVHIVLDAVLGSYIKNIDPEALKISVWNGKIEVDVVEIQPDGFPLPPEVRIVRGTLHRVQIDLPWSNLANQPIKVDVQDVSLLLEVCDRRPEEGTNGNGAVPNENDARTAKRRAETLKRKRTTIDAIEKATQFNGGKTVEAAGKEQNTTAWTQSLMFKLLIKVLDNVQLNIQHIHIRLEDRVSAPACPLAVGVTLESMVIKSADAQWNYTMLVRGAKADSPSAQPASFLRKKIDINKFGLYWSLPLSPVPQSARDDGFAFMRLMQMNFWSGDVAARTVDDARYAKLFQPADYVIKPLTLSLKLTINDGRAKLPITHAELGTRVITRLGTPWMVDTITAIGDDAWKEFVAGMPKLAGDRKYTLSFVFSEAWAVAREQNEEEDDVPSVQQFKDALSSCLQWSSGDVERLEPSIVKYRDAVIHVLQEKCTYIDATATIDDIAVSMQREQYQSGLKLVSFLSWKHRQARYAHLRPVGTSVTENPRRWWSYAISAVLIDVRERLARVDMEAIQQVKARRQRYKDLYLTSLQSKIMTLPTGLVSAEVLGLPSQVIKEELGNIEVTMDIQELLRLRESARQGLLEFASQQQQPPSKPTTAGAQTSAPPSSEGSAAPISSRLWSYTTWLYGGGGNDSSLSKGHASSEGDEIQWSEQDTKVLFEAIDFHPESSEGSETLFKSTADVGEHIWYRCQFVVSQATLQLLDNAVDQPEKCLVRAALSEVDLKVLVRPTSVEVGVQLGDASIVGFADENSSNPRIEIKRMQVDEIIGHHPASVSQNMSCVRLAACEQTLPLIDISVDIAQSTTTSGDTEVTVLEASAARQAIAISVVAQAMTCGVNVAALLEVTGFFSRPSNVDISGLRERAWRQAQRLQRSSAAQVQAALLRRSNVTILVDVVSPLITIQESPLQHSPDKPSTQTDGTVSLVVFLGHLRALSRTRNSHDGSRGGVKERSHSSGNEVVDSLYDIIDVKLSAIEARLCDEDSSADSTSVLLEKTSVNVGIYVSIAATDPTLPLVKLVGGVDSIQVHLDVRTFTMLLRLLRSIGQDIQHAYAQRGVAPQAEDTRSGASVNRLTYSDSTHEETFYSGIETEPSVFAEASSSPARTNRSALYRLLCRVQERQPQKEVSDNDLVKLWQRVLLLVRFQVRDVGVRMRLTTANTDGRVIYVSITSIETDFDMRTYDKMLRFGLGSFCVEEKRSSGSPSRFLIASGDTPEETATRSHGPSKTSEPLIRLIVTNVDVSAPKPEDLANWAQLRPNYTTYLTSQAVDGYVWQDPLVTWLSIDARLRSLVLNLHQDAFADLFLFFYRPSRDATPETADASASSYPLSSGRGGVVRKVARSPEQSIQKTGSGRGLTTKIGTWVASSLAGTVSARQRRMEEVLAKKKGHERQGASIQLRLHVKGMSLVLHQAEANEASADGSSVFIRLIAKDFCCCVDRFPHYLGIFAYLVSMQVSDESVPDESLREVLGSEPIAADPTQAKDEERDTVGHVPSVADILRAVDEVPAVFSCSAQLYGADQIQEHWHPGYANRFTVRLKSPRLRVLYRFLDDLRTYFFDGTLLRTVMQVMFPHRVQVEWDEDFLLLSFSSSQHSAASIHGASPRQPFGTRPTNAATIDVVSMFPLLDVRLEDARLRIPVHRTSSEALVVRLDSFRLSNEYLLDMFGSMTNRVMAKVLLNSSLSQFKVDMDALRIVSVIFVETGWSNGARAELLTQSLLGSTTMSVSVDFSSGNTTMVGIEFSPLRLVCNREQYAFLFRLPIQNFGEARRRRAAANGIANGTVDEEEETNQPAVESGSLAIAEEEDGDDDERELLVTLKVPEFALEILHGQEGYQPSVSGDMSMAEAEKRARGSICSVNVTTFTSSINYGMSTRSWRVSAELREMRIRDTRQGPSISSTYRDVVVFNTANSGESLTPSISIRLLHGQLDSSAHQERALECSFASPHRRLRRMVGSSTDEGMTSSDRPYRKMSSSFFGSETLTGLHQPVRGVSSISARSSRSKSSDANSDHSDRRSLGQPSLRTDVVVDIEGFRVIPSNIHYDVLRFLESPGRGRWESSSSLKSASVGDEPTVDASSEVPPTPLLHHFVVSLSLGKSAILLVEDPSKAMSRAVMFSWEAAISVDFLQRPSPTATVSLSTNNNRLQVRVDLTSIQATSRLSNNNIWLRGDEDVDDRGKSPQPTSGKDELAGDFLKPCDLEFGVDIDFATEFVRFKSAFDRVLDLRFGYLDVCTLRGAVERIVSYPVAANDDAPASSSATKRRLSLESSGGSSSGALNANFDAMTMSASAFSVSARDSTRLSTSRRRRCNREPEAPVVYGSTAIYLVSATFRGPINVRPAVGLYSSPWRKRYLVLPFTAHERESVQPTMFRIVPAAGSDSKMGDVVRFGDRIGLEAVRSVEAPPPVSNGAPSESDEGSLREDIRLIESSPICKYDQLGASGYLGPDGSAGIFETRIWKYGTNAFNSTRSAIRHKDPIVLEELTIYRVFSKGKSYYGSSRLVSAQFDQMEDGDNARVSVEGGGYLMFNGVGDAPIPLVVSVDTEGSGRFDGTVKTPGSSKEKKHEGGVKHQSPPQPSVVALWGKLKVVQFSLPGVNATVVNDFHNMLLPLLHLRVVQLTVDLRGSFESRLTAMAGLQVGIQSYNSQLAVWEPFIEDFDVNLAVHLKGGAVCNYCLSDRHQISLAGTKLRCDGIPTCLFGATKTVVFAATTVRAAEAKHFIYQELLNHQPVTTLTSSGDHDDDAKLTTTCLLVIKKGINVNITRNGVNVLLQFVDLVSRAASNAEQDAWQSRLGAFVYVDNQSGIPFLVAGHPTTTPPETTPPTSLSGPLQTSPSMDESSEETVKLPTLSVGSEDGMLIGSRLGGSSSGVGQMSWIDNRQLTAVMKDMMSASTKWLTVQDGERVPTEIVAHEAPAGSVMSPLRRLMWLRPKSTTSSAKPIPVPIGYSNRSYLHLESNTGYKDPWHGESIICETVAEQGTLVMRLRGKVQLVNHLSFPVEVHYNDKRRAVLAADGRAPHFVPVQYLEGGNMTFCPLLERGQLQRSAHISISSLLRSQSVSRTKLAAVLTGALEVRRVLTFYWNIHPDEIQQDDEAGPTNMFSVSRAPFQVILTASRKSEKHETLIRISPPIRLENLVPYPIVFRTVCTKSERDLAWVEGNEATFSGTSGTVASGCAGQICELEIFNSRGTGAPPSAAPTQVPSAVALSIAIPDIGYSTFSSWTETSFVYGSDNLCSGIELHADETLDDSEKSCPLRLRVEIATVERLVSAELNLLAPVICRVYAEYWLIDRTCLSVVSRTHAGKLIRPWVDNKHASAGIVSQTPVAMYSSQKPSPKIRIGVKAYTPYAEDSDKAEIKSKTFDVSTVGLRGQISLRRKERGANQGILPSLRATELSFAENGEGSVHKQFDIGVMIEQGPAIFSRTTIVTFVPRYYFINTSDRFHIWIKQERDADANAIKLEPRQGCFFHWNDSRLRNRVQLRFICESRYHCCNAADVFGDSDAEDEAAEDAVNVDGLHGMSEWSLPFEVTSVGNFVIRLHRTMTKAASCFGEACYAGDDGTASSEANSSSAQVCETMTGIPLHVGVELHDPAFVVRFHEGTSSLRGVDNPAGLGGPDLDTAEVRDFVSYKLKNECTSMELFVWQVIPVGSSSSSGQSCMYEGGDRVSPFQSMDFVPFAAASSPMLYVQVQSFLETPWSPAASFKESQDDEGQSMPANKELAGLSTPRVLCSFEVSLDKLQSLPVIEFSDGKLTKRLWVEVALEDATKTLRVTDVLPGASSEHRRRRRAALLRSWKRYNTSVRWYSRLLHQNRLLSRPQDGRDEETIDDPPMKQRKHVRFASDAVEEEKSISSSDLMSPNGAAADPVVTVPAVAVAVRVVDACHLEDLYPMDTSVSGLTPFIRLRIMGRTLAGKPESRSLRTQSSKSVFPRWVPGKSSRRGKSDGTDIVHEAFPIDVADEDSEEARDEDCLEVEVREGNKVLFGSTLLGSGRVSLGDYLDALRKDQTQRPPRVSELLVNVTADSSRAVGATRTLVRVQLVGAVFEDYATAVMALAKAIRDHAVEAQLDRLVRCKSQLKVQLERDSVDLALGDGGSKSSPATPNGQASDTVSSATDELQAPKNPERIPSLDARSVSASSLATNDSASDAGNEGIPFDERVLSVVVVGVSNLLIAPSAFGDEEDDSGHDLATCVPVSGDQKVYCTVTYRDSTRSAASSVAKTIAKPNAEVTQSSRPQPNQRPQRPRMVRTHQFPRGVKLGLDLVYHRGRVVIQGVSCNGPCSQLVQDGEISIGDTIVAVNDKSIVNLHRDACFRAIAQACAPAPELDEDVEPAPTSKMTKMISLSFLRQLPSSFNAPSVSDEKGQDVLRYEAEWNRRIEFVDSNDVSTNTPDLEDSQGEDPKNKVLIRVYLRNEQSDHGLTATQEPSVVPFLYFFGDEDTMDHLDHSKEDTRFDKLLGEAWVPLPSRTQTMIEDDQDLAATECVCALYAPKSGEVVDPFFVSTARAMIGQVRIALKWEYRNSLAQLKQQHQLRTFVQLEIQGVFISVIDDGSGGIQRRSPREVLSISLSDRNADTGIQVCYGLVSDGRHVVNTRVGHLQVDNQLLDTNYPVMVFPVRLDDTVQQDQAAASSAKPAASRVSSIAERGPLPEAAKVSRVDASRSANGDRILLPTFQLMGVFSKRRTLFQFEYIFAQLQELDVKVEDAVLVATAHALSGINWSLLKSSGVGDRVGEQANPTIAAGNAALSLVDARWPFPNMPEFPLSMLNVEHRGGNMKVLLRWLLFCPIKMNITFTSTTDRANLLSLVSPEMSSVLRTLISAAAALVSNLDNAAIKVPEFYIENVLETTHTLGFYTMQHYVHHGLRSWYRIVGSVDFLGNPIGLVNALGAGVKDFFYTPAHMLLDDEDGLRIENLRTGMTKGSKSLLRNTAVGIFHTTGKITETLGKGIALLAMDDAYNVERQRQTIRQKKKINDLGDGIAEGGKGFVGGVWDGVKGVVAAPVRGAERDGAGGFVVGMGQGVAGLFVKPAAGFLDMLTSLSRGAKSSAQAIDGGYDHGALAATRVRLPRRICADGVLVAFSEREARGCAILALTSLDMTDDYVYHLDYGVETQRGLLLLTDKRIICLSGKSGQKLWEIALDSSLQVETDNAMLNIAQSKQSNRVYKIECDNDTEAANFKVAVSSARLDLSATRYLLLNLEKKQEEARQNALFGVLAGSDPNAEDGRVDLSLLMGTIQDTMVTGLSEQDLRTQPLRSVQVELCHLENKDAAANVPRRAIDRLLSFSVFQILVYGGPYQWTVYRRFSEFRELYAALEKTGHNNMDALPPLPTRTFLPSTRSTIATQRQEALSNFLQAAIMHSSISGSQAMLEFLTRNAQEVRVSLPPLSPTATTRGGAMAASTNTTLRTP